MFHALSTKEKAISVIGLGYVGLPLALELARRFRVIGFDISPERVALMQQGVDPSGELEAAAFVGKDIQFASDPDVLRQAHFHIVAVPTPVDEHRVPDLRALRQASLAVGRALKRGDYVIYESTVYPGATEEDCLPLLERESGLSLAAGDFKLGYSPERINPGDKEHTVDKILKVVSGSDAEALEEIAAVYGAVITAGIYKAASIRVAEAAKVIENTQRDINIGFVNELSMIFDRMGIDTQEVLAAAGTKWNFLRFSPGLVGGHCIGVDPYYLLHKSKELGYAPQVITSGRAVNDSIPAYIAKKLVQLLIQQDKNPRHTKVLIMGVTFKEDVADIRNSKVADLARELMGYSVAVHLTDPYASPNEVAHEYSLTLVDQTSADYDAVIVAVAHADYRSLQLADFTALMGSSPILFDLKALYDRQTMEQEMTYWRL
jgi:UDP-N-acetyl-D-galactosamine dehydrogenase